MKIWLKAVLLLGCTVGPVGCGRELALPMARETFVDVMVSLRRAALESPEAAAFETKKAEILRRTGVTEEQLRAYARMAPRHARALTEDYDSINARVQRFAEPE